MSRNRTSWREFVASLVLTACAMAAEASAAARQPADAWMPVRTHNPFLQIFGLPAYEAAALVAPGQTGFRMAFDLANHAESAVAAGESVVIDGESYYLTLAFRRRIFERFEVGIDVPFVAHSDGVLDNLIEGWHDLFGMSNAKRAGPSNQLQFRFAHPEIQAYQLDAGRSGLGDVRLGAAMPLASGKRNVSLRVSLKLPTGDAEELLGSGGTDYSVGIYADETGLFGLDRLDLSAHAGVLLTGDSELFAAIQESTVPFGGVAATWRFNEHWEAAGVLYAQGAYFDSELDEIGGSTLQLALGGNYRFGATGPVMSFGIVEELFSDATVDFALQMSLQYGIGRGRAR